MRVRKWILSGAAAASLIVLLAAVGPVEEAKAWDTCGCGHGWGGGRAPCRGGLRGYRGYGGGYRTCGPGPFDHGYGPFAHPRHRPMRCYTQRHHWRVIAHGGSYQLLRRYLYRLRLEPVHRHASAYWYSRWPCALADSATQPVLGGHKCIGHDHPWNECEVALAALGSDETPAVPTSELTAEERLPRGMERFFRGSYEEAAEDFRGAVEADADDARARYGLLLCAFMQKDWASAAKELKRLRAQGEIDGIDRLELDACFGEPEQFRKVREGLAAFTKYNFHRVDAQVVAGWSFVQTGDLDRAKGHLRSALRFDARNAIAKQLLATMRPASDDAAPEPADDPPTLPDDWAESPHPSLARMQE